MKARALHAPRAGTKGGMPAPTLPFGPPLGRPQPIERGTETVTETARRYGIGRGMAYELARRGELPGVIRLGRRLVVAKAVTDRLLGEGASE